MENVVDIDSDPNVNGSYEGIYDINYQTYNSKFDPVVERNIDSQVLFKQSIQKVDIAVPDLPMEDSPKRKLSNVQQKQPNHSSKSSFATQRY